MNSRAVYQALLFLALFLLSVQYQACTSSVGFNGPSTAAKAEPDTDSNANGGGYDGKPTGIYLAYDPNRECESLENGKPIPNKIIEVRGTRPYKTRDECNAVPPVALGLSELKLSEHQARAFSFEGLHFERVETAPAERHLIHICRGIARDASTNEPYLFDALLRAGPQATFTAELLFAKGSGGAPSYQMQSTNEITVASSRNAGSSRFTASNFDLILNESSLVAQVSALIAGASVTGSLDCSPTKTDVNLLAYSQDFTRGPWQDAREPSTVAISPNSTIAPDTSSTASSMADIAASENQRLLYTYLDVAPQDQATRTFSVFLRKGTATSVEVKIQYRGGVTDVTNGATVLDWDANGAILALRNGADVISSGSSPVGGGWHRVWVTVANNGSGNFMARPMVYAASFAADGSTLGSVDVWGAQLEVGATPSTYQPTTLHY